jgi:hypothetical protein
VARCTVFFQPDGRMDVRQDLVFDLVLDDGATAESLHIRQMNTEHWTRPALAGRPACYR